MKKFNWKVFSIAGILWSLLFMTYEFTQHNLRGAQIQFILALVYAVTLVLHSLKKKPND